MKKSLLTPIKSLLIAALTAGALWSCQDEKPEIHFPDPVIPQKEFKHVETITQDTLTFNQGDSVVFRMRTIPVNLLSRQDVTVQVSDTAGSNLASQMHLTASTAAAVNEGMDAETPAGAAAAFADMSGAWYGLTFCAASTITDAEHLAVAAFIEGAGKARRYGVTITNTNVLAATVDTDLASLLKAAGYRRTAALYCSSNPYAICSMFARAFAVNFSGNRMTITLMYKQLPGVVYEQLTETQAQTLEDKNCNVFVLYDNDTAILEYGVNCDGTYFDEVHGADWLADAVPVAIYNLLYQSQTKIPQTDEGTAQLINAAQRVLDQAVQNGFAAPGIWNADGFGTLQRGDRLDSGYYVYMPSVDDQDQSEREERKAPVMQIAVKLAGAIHTADVIISINR